MSSNAGGSTDPVIQQVVSLNSGYKNSEYSKSPPDKVGTGKIYTVKFKGQDGDWRENYVFERGDDRRAYWSLGDLIKDGSNHIFSPFSDVDYLRVVVIAVLAVMFGAALTYLIVSKDAENKGMQTLITVFSLTLGYLVGKSTSK